jgi:hypothetical protein
MKTFLIAGALVCAFFFAPTASLYTQGSLTPPGPPEPTMKTLAQIEPRTIVNDANTPGDKTNTFIISQPGSYYLTDNITGAAGKHGVSIQANDVTLDLNGFALIGNGAGLAFVRGVDLPAAQTNVTIRNGSLRNWHGGGIRADTTRLLAEKLTLTGNTFSPGISVGNGSLVRDCVASTNGLGFQGADRSQFVSCISTENSGPGFLVANYVTITDCTSSRNGGDGIAAGGTYLITRSSSTRNDMNGINTAGVGTIADCVGSNNGADGIVSASFPPVSSSNITNCSANANVGHGIVGTRSSVTNCAASGNGKSGILASQAVVAFCMATSNNQSAGTFQDISANSSSRTGNNPAP